MKTVKVLGGGGAESITIGGFRLELPPPRCITDPRRSRRQLYNRLETWLARLTLEAFHGGREFECRLLTAELHYIGKHLRKNRRTPCPHCPMEILDRFVRW